MLLKSKDDIEPSIRALRELLELPTLTKWQKEELQNELDRLLSGARGEREVAYHIDFRLKDTKNYAIAHDLRIAHNGRTAQIDHLIVGRFLDIILIESKNIGTAIRVSRNGEFEVKTRYGWRGMASPLEQSKRHAIVLESLMETIGVLPRRLGITLRPRFYHWILVPPECTIVCRSKEAEIIKWDLFSQHLDEWFQRDDNPLNLARVLSSETIIEIVRSLVQHHQPITFDYAAKFGIIPPLCENCRAELDKEVIQYCAENREKFSGKLLCRSCQNRYRSVPRCAQCQVELDSKVVAFCRFNSQRFGKKLYCRTCQKTVDS